ncbi:MAG: hypothetical protein V3W41_11400 [Planctomycetota bacterium]
MLPFPSLELSRATRLGIAGLMAILIFGITVANNGVSASSSSNGTVAASPAMLTAKASHFASLNAAETEFWLEVAVAHNGHGADFSARIAAAFGHYNDVLFLASEQLAARINLIDELGPEAYQPRIDPSNFSPNISNPYYPLVVGQTRIYQKDSDDGLETIEVTVLEKTQVINGVTCRVVNETTTNHAGDEEEVTVEWVSQDSSGTVWSFGELTKNYENGFLDNLDGSWRYGKNGAQPGITMLANPQAGAIYRQEYLPAVVEDVARAHSATTSITVTAGTFSSCVMIVDSSALEPSASEQKFFAPGVGTVAEVDLEDGSILMLVEICGPQIPIPSLSRGK